MDPAFAFLFIMLSVIFVPCAGMLLGYVALPYRPVAVFGPVVAIIGGIIGFCCWNRTFDETCVIFLLPLTVPLGIAAGSAIRLGETGDTKQALQQAEHWAALANDAEFNGHLHLFVECVELAGDQYMKAGKPALAVEQLQRGWDRQLERHEVHACMFTLGEKLIAALKDCRKNSEAAAIQAALTKADERAEVIAKEEIAGAAAIA